MESNVKSLYLDLLKRFSLTMTKLVQWKSANKINEDIIEIDKEAIFWRKKK